MGYANHGHHVHYIDTQGDQHEALISKYHGNPTEKPAVNLVILDGIGRPVEVQSVSHSAASDDTKRVWHFPHELHYLPKPSKVRADAVKAEAVGHIAVPVTVEPVPTEPINSK